MLLRPSRLACLLLPLLASCHAFHVSCDGDCDIVVDGVHLEEQHEETLELGSWHASGLTVDSPHGDLQFEATEGPSRVVATVYEVRLGDASVVYEDGLLQARSASGEPAALGDVLVYVQGELPALKGSTGLGAIRLRGLAVAGTIALETGLGDIHVHEVHAGGAATLSSGLGDVEVDGMHSARITAESGLGDVLLRRVATGDADVSSGLGDIALEASAFHILQAETGLGDVDCEGSTYTQGHLESGLGSVDG